jgi:NTP pyrophosphatase (non-canonical NTP hydrolase)
MDFKKIIERAIKVRSKYEKFEKRKWGKVWGKEQIMEGFVVDVGDLTRIIMEKEGWRKSEVGGKLGHELSDCLWSIIVLAEKYGVNLEEEFENTMKEIENMIKENADH